VKPHYPQILQASVVGWGIFKDNHKVGMRDQIIVIILKTSTKQGKDFKDYFNIGQFRK
jgi:hypothetical protein